jgi:hypothetical protein
VTRRAKTRLSAGSVGLSIFVARGREAGPARGGRKLLVEDVVGQLAASPARRDGLQNRQQLAEFRDGISHQPPLFSADFSRSVPSRDQVCD